MPAPTAIQKQIEDANALHAQVYGGDSVVVPDQSDIDVINNLPGVSDDTPTDPIVVAEPVVALVDPIVVEPDGGDPSPAAPTEVAGKTDEDFEHKYKVLQGKYNSEVPKLNENVKGLRGELDTVRTLLASLENGTAPVELQAGVSLLKDDEVEEYGSDMIDVIKRAAREEFMPLITQLQTENGQLREALGGMSESVSVKARDSLFTVLTTEIPNWKEINQDTGFLEWLEGMDTYSGSQRSGLLTQAFENNDAARVLAFFKGYLDENVVVSDPTPNPAPIDPKVDLMSMAAPGAPRDGSAPSAHTDKRVYSQADIAQFYRAVQKGVYKNRDAERMAIEQDILSAGPEGRLR